MRDRASKQSKVGSALVFRWLLLAFLHRWNSVCPTVQAFSVTNSRRNVRDAAATGRLVLWSSPPTDKETQVTTMTNSWDNEMDDEKPAGIVGAEFFGGDKRKEEFYDPQAEQEAARLERQTSALSTYHRFGDRAAFADEAVAAVAQSVQRQINRVLRPTNVDASNGSIEFPYAPSVQWTTPMPSQSKHPLKELEVAQKFYRQADVAILSGSASGTQANVFDLRWEISVQWPAIWEPRIVLSGSSLVTVSERTIVAQVDTLDAELIPTIQAQISPRFWDLYHIGMTPAAESRPPLNQGISWSPLKSYTVSDIAPRLVSQPTQWETGSRDDANAATIPNHAFSCVITTMGPTKQRFTPVTGVEVQLRAAAESPTLELQWFIPIATEYAAREVLDVPGVDPEMNPDSAASCRYMYCPRRRVATIPYGGSPQDGQISNLRKQLYDQVVRDGLQPKLDESGRPVFFFTMNSIKACYSNEGLGMAVYEWRPQFTKPNHVGIELEL